MIRSMMFQHALWRVKPFETDGTLLISFVQQFILLLAMIVLQMIEKLSFVMILKFTSSLFTNPNCMTGMMLAKLRIVDERLKSIIK